MSLVFTERRGGVYGGATEKTAPTNFVKGFWLERTQLLSTKLKNFILQVWPVPFVTLRPERPDAPEQNSQ